MNKKPIFITLYLALACFVGIGTYCLIDTEVQKRQNPTTEVTTEEYVTEAGDQFGIIDSIDNHVANQPDDGTTEYMADQLSPDFECYDSNNPDNPEAVVWYTPTTKATTEEPKDDATTAAPGNSTTPTTEAPAASTEAPAASTEAPATEAPTEAPAATEAPATEAPATEAPATEAPAPEAPAEPAP